MLSMDNLMQQSFMEKIHRGDKMYMCFCKLRPAYLLVMLNYNSTNVSTEKGMSQWAMFSNMFIKN